MEIIISQKPQENHSPTYSPNRNATATAGAATSINNGSSSSTTKPAGVSRSDHVNPYPTTFVQADTSNFKQVVQLLTGSPSSSPENAKIPSDPLPNKLSSSSSSIPPIKSTGQKKQGFKLYERRNSLKNGFIISPLIPSSSSSSPYSPNVVGFSPRNRQTEILSPSILDFPSLHLSPVTPLNEDPFHNNNNNNYYYNSSSSSSSASSPSMPHAAAAGVANSSSEEEEEKAIAEKKFYLHPSPRSTAEPPQLLPLFPVTSPRVSAAVTSSPS